MHKVKVESLGVPYAKVLIDGKPIKAVKLDMHIEADSVPETEVTLRCEPDMEYDSLVSFGFTPRTVKAAVDVLKIALKRNDFIAFMGMNDLMKITQEKKCD